MNKTDFPSFVHSAFLSQFQVCAVPTVNAYSPYSQLVGPVRM